MPSFPRFRNGRETNPVPMNPPILFVYPGLMHILSGRPVGCFRRVGITC